MEEETRLLCCTCENCSVSAHRLCCWAALSWEKGNRWQFNRKLIALFGVGQGLSGELGEKLSAKSHSSLEKELLWPLPATSALGGARGDRSHRSPWSACCCFCQNSLEKPEVMTPG